MVAEYFFFFQAEDGIRDLTVTGVQTCALPISPPPDGVPRCRVKSRTFGAFGSNGVGARSVVLPGTGIRLLSGSGGGPSMTIFTSGTANWLSLDCWRPSIIAEVSVR